MTMKINSDIIRLLIVDISGTYSKIYDEVFVSKDKENKIRNKYNENNNYKVIRTL